MDTATILIGETELSLQSAKQQINDGDQKINAAIYELNIARTAIAENEQNLTNTTVEIEENEQLLRKAKQELTEKKQEYQKTLTEFEETKIVAEKEISDNEEWLLKAQDTLDELEIPIYSINSRREAPGSDGYKIYSSVSTIIDSLTNVFPLFMYLVAALVTFTTMTRFVDDERINSGTFKALGYSNYDVIKKFTMYGFISSTIGAIIGIILGHTLLPTIVYDAYGTGFSVPRIEFHFNWGISMMAIVLAFISAVVPAYIVARKELRDNPTKLLSPKAPPAGSKIFLEYLTPIWNRLSFTQKVTARNIFRYKKRMLMTIFGVCGSVAILFAGFGVQHSISGIIDRQFGEVIHYDLILAHNEHLKEDQQEELNELLGSDAVTQYNSIYYEELSKVAGNSNDKQIIKLIVPDDINTFSEYIKLVNQESSEELSLKDEGAIISERLAKLLDIEVGDTIILKDSSDNDINIKVTDITEMYMGHFMFMNTSAYQKAFNKDYSVNANLAILKDKSLKNTEEQAAKFIEMSGMKGVVQNMAITTQIKTITESLDDIIGILSGYGFGYFLQSYIITTVPPEDVMFNHALGNNTFIIPAIIITITTVILGFFVRKKLKNVDMLEALKSVE